MTNRLFAVTFDCADAAELGGFWAQALGQELDPGRATLTASTLPADPPVDAVRVFSNLKTYLETAHQPPVQAPPRPTGWLARLRRPREQKGTA